MRLVNFDKLKDFFFSLQSAFQFNNERKMIDKIKFCEIRIVF